MRSIFKVMFAILLSMGMLKQGSFASTDQVVSGSRQNAVRKCCQAGKVDSGTSCHVMRCCRTSEEVPAPVSLRVSTGSEIALVLPGSILSFAPMAARPPTDGCRVIGCFVSSVPLYQRYCSILI